MNTVTDLFRSIVRCLFNPAAWRNYLAPRRLQRVLSFRAWFDLGFKMVDARRLDFYFRWFVAAMLIYHGTWLLEWREWLTSYGFHYTADTRHWYNPDPWPPLQNWMVPIYAVALFGSGLLIVWGWRTRIMVWPFFFCELYAMLVDVDSAFTINKYAVAFTFLIGLSYMPGMIQTGVDAAGNRVRLQPVWPIRLIMLACFIQYFTSGYCKVVHGDWVRPLDEFPYGELDWTVLWSQTMGVYRTHFASFLLNHTGPWFWLAGMWFTLVFELGAPVLLGVRPLRPWGIGMGIALHLGIALLMYKLAFFSLQMCVFYFLFMEEGTVVRLHAWFGARLKQPFVDSVRVLLPRVRTLVSRR